MKSIHWFPFKHAIIPGFLAVAAALILSRCAFTLSNDPPIARKSGQVEERADRYGTFYVYIPESISKNPKIVLLIHGTPAKEVTAEATAKYYITNWTDFAEKYGCVLIAPAFNQEDFSSREGDHAMTGYRGLFGREIAADEWVLRLVKAYQQAFGVSNQRFYLYGHSAGGQFAGRFIVTHPEVVERVVISSAATYPQPQSDVAWPFGMGELHTRIQWDENTITTVNIIPDRQKWLAATQIPLTIIVGMNDTSELPSFPGQKGNNRFAIAQNWISDMAAFAEENELESRFQFEMIPGTGHSMSGLILYSQEALSLD